MTDLTEFLLARIAEDEDAARTASGKQVGFSVAWTDVEVVRHLDRWTTPRVLVECDAKRRIVDEWLSRSTAGGWFHLACLALPYADHSDYREEWRP